MSDWGHWSNELERNRTGAPGHRTRSPPSLHGNMNDFTVWLCNERREVIRVFWVNKAASGICRLQQEPTPALMAFVQSRQTPLSSEGPHRDCQEDPFTVCGTSSWTTTYNKDGRSARNCVSLTAKQRAGVKEPVMKQLWSLSWPSPAHPSPARPGFSVGRIAVSLVRQPGALGRWQGMRASGRGPLKSHLRGATPTWPLRWRLFWASPEAACLPFLEQQQSRPHAVASSKVTEE
ncbi:hypothetical protein Q8A73_005848 [Channa argus]|nr:hypothetical protein Q8A73_005848 [Channa argus]